MGERDAAGGTGSARWRRERRLRSWVKHERLSIAMTLATVTHHSFQVGTAYDALRSHKPVTSAGGLRPLPLVEGRPQERFQRHTVEQIADSVPVVPVLFMVEPQVVVQLVDILSPLDFRVAEQVIEVPKIVCPRRAARTVLCAPQLAEQLVEVPAPVSYSSSQRSMCRSLTFQFLVVEVVAVFLFFPRTEFNSSSFSPERISERIVERFGAGGDFPSRRAGPRVVLPRQGPAAAGSEQIADIPSSGGPHGFLPGQVSTAPPGPVHVDEHLPDSSEWVQFRASATRKPYYWNRRTNATAWKPPPGTRVVWVGEKDEEGRLAQGHPC